MVSPRELEHLQFDADNIITGDPGQQKRLLHSTNQPRQTRSSFHIPIEIATIADTITSTDITTATNFPTQDILEELLRRIDKVETKLERLDTNEERTATKDVQNGELSRRMKRMEKKVEELVTKRKKKPLQEVYNSEIFRRLEQVENKLGEVDANDEVAELQDMYNESLERCKQLERELLDAKAAQTHLNAPTTTTVQLPESNVNQIEAQSHPGAPTMHLPTLNAKQIKQEVQDTVEDDQKPSALSDHDFRRLAHSQTATRDRYSYLNDSDDSTIDPYNHYVQKHPSSRKRARQSN